MIEIQCTSCHTRYRIDERVLPDDTPTFKCSRCGHVFNADPVPAKPRKPAPPAAESEAQPARTIRPARPRPAAFKSPVENDVVKREPAAEQRPVPQREPEVRSQPAKSPAQAAAPPDQPREQRPTPRAEMNTDDPLDRPFSDREQKADTGENLKFDFSDERNEVRDSPPEHEFERPEPHDRGWQVGDVPDDFQSTRSRAAPTMMADAEDAEASPPPRRMPVRRMASPLRAEAPRFASAPAAPAGFQLGQVVEDRSEGTSARGTHASGFFLAMFLFVAIAFFGASALICDEPAASARLLSQAPHIGSYFARPIVPAMLVTLHGVRSEYYTLKGGHVALVIAGSAQNVGGRALHLVEIDANLLGNGAHPLARQTVYCGNELSAKMLGEMTPREIEFSQALSPQKSFALEPSASAPFLIVFIDPPAGAGKIRISVSKATAPDSGAASLPPA